MSEYVSNRLQLLFEDLVGAGLTQVSGIRPDCGNSVRKHERKQKSDCPVP